MEAPVSAEDAKWFEDVAQNASKLQTAAFEVSTLRIEFKNVYAKLAQGLPPSLIALWQRNKERKESELCGRMAKLEGLQAKADEQQRAKDYVEQAKEAALVSKQALAEAEQAAAQAQ